MRLSQAQAQVAPSQVSASSSGHVTKISELLCRTRKEVVCTIKYVPCCLPPFPHAKATKIKYGVMFDTKETEGTKRRHQVDTVVEGM